MKITCADCKQTQSEYKCQEPKLVIDFSEDRDEFKLDLTIGLGITFKIPSKDTNELAHREEIVRNIQIEIENFVKYLQKKYHQNQL